MNGKRKAGRPSARRATHGSRDLTTWRGDYTQAQIAQTLGVSINTYSHWECGVTRIPKTMELLMRVTTAKGLIETIGDTDAHNKLEEAHE